MIRRNVAGGGAAASPSSGQRTMSNSSAGTPSRIDHRSAGAGRAGSHRSLLSSNNSNRQRSVADTIVALLLIAAAILTVISFVFPETQEKMVQEVEREAEVAQKMLHQAEDEILHWHEHHQPHAAIPPKTIQEQQQEQQQGAYDAEQAAASDRRMRQATDGSWVEGEKKLKAKLKVLAERQAQGQDLGVPVLTRWLGEDIPAWPNAQTMPEEEWKKRVEEKYAEMRQEEMAWRERMTEALKNVNHG